MRLINSTCVLASILLVSGCSAYFSSLTIVNNGSTEIDDVSVEGGGRVYRLDNIKPRHSVTFSGHVGGEGVPLLRFRQHGLNKSFEACYYTETIPPNGTIIISDDKIERRCDL